MKVTVVYHADKGDSKVVEWGAFTFFDGVPVEIEDNEANAHMLSKIQINRFFDIVGVKGGSGPYPQEPEVYPEETPDDDPESEQESEPEDETEEDGAELEEKTSFKDYVPVREKTAKAKSDRTRAKPKRGQR